MAFQKSVDRGYLQLSGLTDYALLVKLGLTSIVVLTSLGAYLVASGLEFLWFELVLLGIGGFGVTAASNALNEVLEKDYDGLMKRTSMRPLVKKTITPSNAVLFAGISCLIGVTCLSYFNPICGFLGMLAFVLYAFVYTPLKRYHSIAVFIGAIAGAMPMMIGVIAYSTELLVLALLLFLVQFLWQFPHFWSIAFKGYEDYVKAGFRFIPEGNTDDVPSKNIGLSSILMSILLLPVIICFFGLGYITSITLISLLVLTIGYIILSFRFHLIFDQNSALQLLLGSFIYIPSVLIFLIIGLL